MSTPITLDLEVTSPAAAGLEISPPLVDVAPDTNGPTVVLVAVPGSQGPRGLPGEGSGVFGETPSGVQDGNNTVFALAHTPRAGTTVVYRNGLREILDVGYTVTGSDITFSTPPLSSDVLACDYLMEG